MPPVHNALNEDSPEEIVFNEVLVKAFVDGQLDPEVEDRILTVVERCPELLQNAAILSSVGFLKKLRAVHQRSAFKKTTGRQSIGDFASSSYAVDPSAVTSEKPHVTERSDTKTAVPTELAKYAGYRVLKELGRGGMGVVYLAKNVSLDRLEVLKVLSERLLDHPGAKERFMREIRAVSKLNHPNIVTSYSVLPLESLLVFAMEHVHGMDLHQFIYKHTHLPIALACFFARQIADGLQHAHEKGLVHRDIKPSNVIVHKSGSQLQVKILDFGLAKATSEKSHSGLTQDGSLLGTPEYMSPEQILNAAKADIRADIYGLGCTLYCMLIGQPPFSGTHGEVLMAHSQKDARPVHLLRPEVPIDLSTVIAKMTAKDASRRYQTPNEVYAALKPFLNRQLVRGSVSNLTEIDTVNDLASPSRDTSVVESLVELSLTPEPLPPSELSVQQQIATAMAGHRLSRASRSPPSRRRPNWFRNIKSIIYAIVSTLLAGLLWLSVLTFRTSEGTLIVENLPRDAEVLIDGQRMEIKWNDAKDIAEIRVASGKQQVEVRSKGVKVAGESVEVSANQRVPLKISIVPSAGSPEINKQKTIVVIPELTKEIAFSARLIRNLYFDEEQGLLLGTMIDKELLEKPKAWNYSLTCWNVHADQVYRNIPTEWDAKGVAVDSANGLIAYVEGYGWARQFHVYGLEERKELASFCPEKNHGGFCSMMFREKGTEILTLQADGTLRGWNWSSGAELSLPAMQWPQWVGTGQETLGGDAACFSKDGARVFVSHQDGNVYCCDAHTGKNISRMSGLTAVSVIATSGSGTHLAAISLADNCARAWKVDSEEVILNLPLTGLSNHALAITQDGTFVAIGFESGKVQVWNTARKQLVSEFIAHRETILDLAFSELGTSLATASSDPRIRIWKLPVQSFALSANIDATVQNENLVEDAADTVDRADMWSAWRSLFNGENFANWKFTEKTASSWSIRNGELVGAGNEEALVSINEFTEFELAAEIAISKTNSGIYFGGRNGFECELCIPSSERIHALGSILLQGDIAGRAKPVVLKRVLPASGQWFQLSLVNTKDKLQVLIDDELVVNENGPRKVEPGPIEFSQWIPGGHIAIRSLRVREIDSSRVSTLSSGLSDSRHSDSTEIQLSDNESPLPSVELLRNPSCEEPLGNDGSIPGWKVVRGGWQSRNDDPLPKHWSSFFCQAEQNL